jgi:hypothetical protein
MTSTWPEEPGYHWVTHNDSATNHLAKAAEALNANVPDAATAQVHATLAQAEATLVVVHTLRDIMGRLHEQAVVMENLRRTIAAFEPPGEDDSRTEQMAYSRSGEITPGA